MTKLDDPLFGTKREEPSTTGQASKLDSPTFGSNKPSENPYVSSKVSEQRRKDRGEQAFNKKLQREIKYGRLSQESRARLASDAMNSFVNQVIAQKSSSTLAINHSSLETQTDKIPTVTTTQSPLINEIGSPPQAPPRSFASSDGMQQVMTSIPSSGTHVLGAVNGSLQWIATEEC